MTHMAKALIIKNNLPGTEVVEVFGDHPTSEANKRAGLIRVRSIKRAVDYWIEKKRVR